MPQSVVSTNRTSTRPTKGTARNNESDDASFVQGYATEEKIPANMNDQFDVKGELISDNYFVNNGNKAKMETSFFSHKIDKRKSSGDKFKSKKTSLASERTLQN